MATIDEVQDKNGIVKDIVDKKLNSKTSQSTVASSDYVLLEDTDGAYHKIQKASFVEAIRSVFGSVLNGVAKGSDIAKVPVLDSNNDLGVGTLTALATLLGAKAPFEMKDIIVQSAGTTISGLSCGYGILIVSNISSGHTALYILGATEIINVGGNAEVTVSKNGEYTLSITPLYSGKSIRAKFISPQ